MESIEKLRTAARNMAKGRNLEHHEECNLLLLIADEIEAEIAERYMKLPVDADGVPIHEGDLMDSNAFGVVEVEGFIHGAVAFWIYDPQPAHVATSPANLLHHKPRTLEDVLRDCCNEWNKHLSSDWEAGVYAKYAAEIRELLGVGE